MANVDTRELPPKIRKRISQDLIEFADRLNPCDEFYTEGFRLVENVVTTMKESGIFSIDRHKYTGSLGKRTSVIYPDMDVVVLVNGKKRKGEPPNFTLPDDLRNKLAAFKTFLTDKAVEFDIDPKSIKQKSITCSFEFNNGIEVDLLPGCNFSQVDKEKQYKEVLKQIQEIPRGECFWLSSSLVEMQMEFLKQHPANQLIRLAKYWFKSLTLDSPIYGGSLIIEVLGVAVLFEMDNNTNTDMRRAFKLFLGKIRDLRSQQIAFIREDNKKTGVTWRLLEKHEFTSTKYEEHFDMDIMSSSNFILEPSNPYNNLMRNFDKKDEVVDKLQRFALKTLERIDSIEVEMPSSVPFNILFEPMPICLREEYPYSAIPSFILFEYAFGGYHFPNCKDVCRAGVIEAHEGSAKVIECVKNNLLFLLRNKAQSNQASGSKTSFPDGYANVSLPNVKDCVETLINCNFGAKSLVRETSNDGEHRSYHVTLYIPYKLLGGQVRAIRFSMQWYS